MSHISIQSENGLRVSADIRQHQLTLDVPAEKGGGGGRPDAGGIAGCCAGRVHDHARRDVLPIGTAAV